MKKADLIWVIATVALLFYLFAALAPEVVQASNKFYNDTMLSDEAYEACVEIGQQYGISPELLMAIAETESSGNPEARNGSCKGLMQISESYHKDRMQELGVENIYDEEGNILLATDYLLQLFMEEEDVGLVLSIYHGESSADATYEAGELSEYAKKILERAEELTRNHDKFRNAVG